MTSLRPGDRIRLLAMGNDPDPLPVGSTGTVRRVREVTDRRGAWQQVSVAWDSGRSLMLAVPPDAVQRTGWIEPAGEDPS